MNIGLHPLIRKVDCLRVPVPDIEAGIRFYRDGLGHSLIWRTDHAAGLRMSESEGEIVIQAERPELEVDLLVTSVNEAVERVTTAGGRVVEAPFEIAIGRCCVVADPFGNPLVLLDSSKGRLVTDADGNVTGVSKE